MHTVTLEDGTTSRHCIRTAHAEQNVLANAARFGVAVDRATLYCQMAPCYICAKMLINAGIVRIVCAKDYHASSRSKEVFKEAGIELTVIDAEVQKYSDQ